MLKFKHKPRCYWCIETEQIRGCPQCAELQELDMSDSERLQREFWKGVVLGTVAGFGVFFAIGYVLWMVSF
jgi:hypothetical protein